MLQLVNIERNKGNMGIAITQYSDQTKDWTTRVRFPAGAVKGFFSLRQHVQTGLWPTQPLIHWVPGDSFH